MSFRPLVHAPQAPLVQTSLEISYAATGYYNQIARQKFFELWQ